MGFSCAVGDIESNKYKNCRGIPPVHRQILGENPTQYWLPDSGTTAHMTPYMTNLDPKTFKPFKTVIKVANGHKASVIGYGNVTITIRDYFTQQLVNWTLFDVYIIPTLTRRLISTDSLVELDHEITFAKQVVTFKLHSQNKLSHSSCAKSIQTPTNCHILRSNYHAFLKQQVTAYSIGRTSKHIWTKERGALEEHVDSNAYGLTIAGYLQTSSRKHFAILLNTLDFLPDFPDPWEN